MMKKQKRCTFPPANYFSSNKLHVTFLKKKNCVIKDNVPLHENQKFCFIIKEHCRSNDVDDEHDYLFIIPLI